MIRIPHRISEIYIKHFLHTYGYWQTVSPQFRSDRERGGNGHVVGSKGRDALGQVSTGDRVVWQWFSHCVCECVLCAFLSLFSFCSHSSSLSDYMVCSLEFENQRTTKLKGEIIFTLWSWSWSERPFKVLIRNLLAWFPSSSRWISKMSAVWLAYILYNSVRK